MMSTDVVLKEKKRRSRNCVLKVKKGLYFYDNTAAVVFLKLPWPFSFSKDKNQKLLK